MVSQFVNDDDVSRVNPLGRLASIKLAGEGFPVVAGDNREAMALEATRKLSHPSARAIASTGFL
jgi:hypothetical protein